MKTVNITDFEQQSPTLAKVIISHTGNPTSAEIINHLTSKLGYAATPVKASFRSIKPGVAVGFVRANKEVRVVAKTDLESYKVLGSNILMDKEDKTLWDLKSGAGGNYLARHGQEDLSCLVSAATYSRPDLPGVRHLTIAKASPKEFVAFVDSDGSMDYGFAVGTSESKVKVVSTTRRQAVTVEYASVVAIQPVPVPTETQRAVTASLTPAEKKDSIAYYTRLYSYDPSFLKETIKNIEEGTLV